MISLARCILRRCRRRARFGIQAHARAPVEGTVSVLTSDADSLAPSWPLSPMRPTVSWTRRSAGWSPAWPPCRKAEGRGGWHRLGQKRGVRARRRPSGGWEPHDRVAGTCPCPTSASWPSPRSVRYGCSSAFHR